MAKSWLQGAFFRHYDGHHTAIVLYGMAIPFGQAGIMSLGYAGI